MPEMERWRGRVALVTGASSGIGWATARLLAAEGLKVVASARSAERLDALRREVADSGGELMVAPCDLRREPEILALFRAIRERWGGVDVLINNAGLGHKAPLMSGDTAHWREMLEVNVLALCVCTREAISDMRRRGDDGHVVHISSMAAHRVPGMGGVYSASKFAVRALTEGLRQELRWENSAIRVSSISPGLVETGFASHFLHSEAEAEKTYGRFPVLQPEDIAQTVRYVLASPPHMQVHDVLIRPTRQES